MVAKASIANTSRLEGKLNTHVDNRVTPWCVENFEDEIVYHTTTGKRFVPCIPIRCVDRILSENRELRETLFVEFNTTQQESYDALQHAMGNGTTAIKQNILLITSYLREVTERELWKLVYGVLMKHFPFSFEDKPATMSHLNYVWRCGQLPTLSLIVSLMLEMTRLVGINGRDEFVALVTKLASVNASPAPISPF